MTGWGMFWLAVIIFICIDTYVFLKGYDSVIYQYKTPIELESQRQKLGIKGAK